MYPKRVRKKNRLANKGDRIIRLAIISDHENGINPRNYRYQSHFSKKNQDKNSGEAKYLRENFPETELNLNYKFLKYKYLIKNLIYFRVREIFICTSGPMFVTAPL
jgi:hypothetical protein